MFEILEDLFKEFQKNNQKIHIRTIGMLNIQTGMGAEKKISEKRKEEIKTAKMAVTKTNDCLQRAVQGQFGKKVTEALGKQEDTLDSF